MADESAELRSDKVAARRRAAEFFTGSGTQPGDDNPSLRLLRDHTSLLDGFVDVPASRHVDETGSRIADFRLVRLLGYGGMASVYEASYETCRRRNVALKVSRPGDRIAAAQLVEEARSLARVAHRGVVAALGSGTVAGRAWLALELLPGPALSHQATPDVDTCIEWFRHLAATLCTVHGRGLVHRDVKPANIVFRSPREPVLIDFGLAISPEGSRRRVRIRKLSGTLRYMSPEQTMGGFAAVGPPSDVYALAVTMYEVLTGVSPAERHGRERMLEVIAFSRTPSPRRFCRALPRAAEAVFEKALAKDPNRRYPSGKELSEDLDAVCAGRPLRHASEPLRARLWRRRRSLGVAVVVVVAAAGSLLTTSLLELRARRDELKALENDMVLGRPLAALARIDTAWPWLEQDTEFRDLVGRYSRELGRAQTQLMLAETGLSSGAEAAPEQAARADLAARMYRGFGGADFAFQIVWLELLECGAKAAAETLAAMPESRGDDPRLLDLAALLAAETSAQEWLASVEQRLASRAEVDALTPLEACFRGIRHLHRVRVARRSPKMALPQGDIDGRIAAAEHHIGVARGATEDRVSVLATGLLALAQGDGTAAQAVFDDLAARARLPGARNGARLYGALAQSMQAPFTGPDARLPDMDARSVWWLVRVSLEHACPEAALRWLARIDASHLSASRRRVMLQLTVNTMVEGQTRQRFELVRDVGRRAIQWLDPSWPVDDRSKVEECLGLWTWLSYRLANHYADAGDTDRARAWCDEARRGADACVAKQLLRSYEPRAVAALSRWLELRLDAAPDSAAVEASLRSLLQSKTVAAARAAALRPEHAASVDATVGLIEAALYGALRSSMRVKSKR